MASPLEIERDGPIAYVWLNRPKKRNALNRDALEGIAEVFSGFARDFALRAVVLAGRGVSFCGGVDLANVPAADRLSLGSDATDRERRWLSQLGSRAVRAVQDCEIPTVARVQGHAVGGGALLAVACDFRIMSSEAEFAIPELDLGLPLTWSGTPRLISEIGAARARELVMIGESVGAGEAVRLGLAHRSVPGGELDAAVRELAERLARKPEAAVHMTKTQFRAYGTLARLGDVTETDGDVLGAAGRSADARARFGR
jgi:enoyl-CoA hydratase/carnithine racemase